MARASGACAAAAVSVLICLGHFFFAYAQLTGQDQDCPGFNGTSCPNHFEPGGLAKILMYANAEYDAHGWLSSALGLVEEGACHTDCPHGNATFLPAGEGAAESVCDLLACDTCVSLLGLGSEQRCRANIELTLLHMSYLYSVIHLWGQDEAVTCQLGTEPSCTGIYPGRPAAAPA